jgi:hypothetical protein
MREARPHRSNMDTEMSTSNRGQILAWERGNRAWPPGDGGGTGRNSFLEPEDVVIGPNGRVGGGDPMNTNDPDGCFMDGTTQ